ncbi:CPBP family intramembrane glutamic endopeptidase [Zobellia nedashkovskayae]
MIWKIITYVLITIVITGILAAIQQKINLDFNKVVLPQIAPAIGFLIIILLFKDIRLPIETDLNSLIITITILALVIPLILLGISFLIGNSVGLKTELTKDLTSLIPVMIIGIIIGSIGEEIGWRSFLQPTLEKNNSVLLASIFVGLIWGLWHIGHYKNGFLFMIAFLIFTISASIMLSLILKDTKHNIIISVFFHISINLGFIIFFKNSLTDSKLMIINGLVWLIPTVGILLISGKDLMKT